MIESREYLHIAWQNVQIYWISLEQGLSIQQFQWRITVWIGGLPFMILDVGIERCYYNIRRICQLSLWNHWHHPINLLNLSVKKKEGNCSWRLTVDAFREGWPKSVVIPKNIDEGDRHMTYSKLQASLNISQTAIHSIQHKYLAVENISSRKIRHDLTKSQKISHVNWVKKCRPRHCTICI